MKPIRKLIDENSTGKRVFLLFILTNLVYAVMLLITIPNTMAFSNGMKLLDMMPTGYDSNYIYTLFEVLGENGRHAYLYDQIPVDMVYPFLFGLSYCLLLGYFLKKIVKLNSPFFYLCFLPLIAALADYFENLGIITMLNNYPNLSQTSIKATNYFSIVKSISTTLFFVALIITLLVLGIKTINERKMNPTKV